MLDGAGRGALRPGGGDGAGSERSRTPERTWSMASDPKFVDFVVDQIADDCAVTSRKMFGEYGLYSGGTFFGLICDDRLFVKPTEGGRAFIGDVVEGPPYPGAKPSLLIGDGVEDPEWLSELVRITVRELPAPKPKKPK